MTCSRLDQFPGPNYWDIVIEKCSHPMMKLVTTNILAQKPMIKDSIFIKFLVIVTVNTTIIYI
jgi:hypothetical protein